MASKRRAIHLAGVSHGPGRPAGSRIGNLIYSATLSGRDPETGQLPEDPADQMRVLFETMVRFVDAAGASLDDVIRVNVTLADVKYRNELNAEWAKYFSDEESLPTRRATIEKLGGGAIADLELVAYVDS